MACERWWHPKCVGLPGLTKAIWDKICNWRCSNYFTFKTKIRD